MDLIETIQKIIQNNEDARKPTDLTIGTVTSVSPLAVSTNANMPPIPEQALILTDSVKKRIVSGIEVQSDLAPGDGVIMLRVMRGQKFIILSKIV